MCDAIVYCLIDWELNDGGERMLYIIRTNNLCMMDSITIGFKLDGNDRSSYLESIWTIKYVIRDGFLPFFHVIGIIEDQVYHWTSGY